MNFSSTFLSVVKCNGLVWKPSAIPSYNGRDGGSKDGQCMNGLDNDGTPESNDWHSEGNDYNNDD